MFPGAEGCGASVAGWLNCTLHVTVGTWRLPFGISLTTRMYNGVVPGPVLSAQPGDRVRLRLVNHLEADLPPPPGVVGYRTANTTNLHL